MASSGALSLNTNATEHGAASLDWQARVLPNNAWEEISISIIMIMTIITVFSALNTILIPCSELNRIFIR